MPARHELATSRWSWLAIIPTCLAKIGIVVPARGDCGLGGHFASKARHGGSRRGYRQPAAHGRLQFLEFRQRQLTPKPPTAPGSPTTAATWPSGTTRTR